jgi:uncharacterized membrane protein YgcG
MRKSLFLCFVLLLLAVLTLTAFAADAVTVIDSIGLLSYEEQAKLSELFAKESETGVSFYVYTTKTVNANDYPTDREVRLLCGLKEDENAVVLVVRQALKTY